MRYIISFLMASAALPAMAEAPRVVTDLPPVHALVAEVMGEIGTPLLLLDQGADAHSFQLRPSQARALAEADLLVWIGPEMTPWLERALDGLAAQTPRLDLLLQEGTQRRPYTATEDHDDQNHDDHGLEDHEAEAGHDDHDDHGHDDHDHGDIDPHAWLDPGNAALWLRRIGEDLGRIAPENAAPYTANAARAIEEVTALDAEVSARLTPLRDRPFVVFHDAYGYFTDHYGLTGAKALALGDASAPGAARLAALRDDIAGAGPICLFPELQHDPRLLAQLAEGTEARIGTALDPEGSGIAPGKGAYTALLRGLTDALTDCLGE